MWRSRGCIGRWLLIRPSGDGIAAPGVDACHDAGNTLREERKRQHSPRVAALAQPREVLVSHTVEDLVAGSPLEFEPRGAHRLKRVPGEWSLFAAVGGGGTPK